MSNERATRNAADEHDAILDALENQDLTTACERLRDNMLSAMKPLLARLDGVAKR
jgi:DNA-binding GntR family transcriptional regulator